MAVTEHLPDAGDSIALNVRRCGWFLFGATACIGAASYVMHLVTMAADADSIATLDVGDEVSIGTWFATLLFIAAATALFFAGRQEDQGSRRGGFGGNSLAIVMILLSIDESASLHERFGDVLEEVVETGGFLHYIWVVPGTIFVVAVVLGHLGWLRTLPASTRNGMVLGGVVFVVGAVGMEILAAPLAEAGKDETLAVVSLIAIEEFLEMAGLSVFIIAVLGHLQGQRQNIAFT